MLQIRGMSTAETLYVCEWIRTPTNSTTNSTQNAIRAFERLTQSSQIRHRFRSGRSPSPAATSSTDAPQLAGHRHLGDLASAAHRKVEERTAPLRPAAHRNLRRFHQQKAQQHIALLADVAQAAGSPPLGSAAESGWNIVSGFWVFRQAPLYAALCGSPHRAVLLISPDFLNLHGG